MLPLQILLTNLLILMDQFLATNADNYSTRAYIYYENAECASGSQISGSLVYAYNDQRMQGKGFTKKNYHGPCKYFEGGSFDFMYSSKDSGSYMKNGYCIRCNGIIGCTDTRYSCSGFSTVVPNQAYTLSQNESDENENKNVYNNPEEMVDYEIVEENLYQEISQYTNNGDTSSTYITVFGAFLGMCALVAVGIGSTAIRRLREKHATIDADTLSGDSRENCYNGGELI